MISNSRKIALAAAAVALTAVSAQLVIPLRPVPVTLQVFAVLVCGGMLGSRIGGISQLLYLILGLAGAPVFAGLRGGPQTLLSPSFGYALGFPAAAAIAGLFDPRGERRRYFVFPLALIPIYILGPLYLYFIAPLALGKSMEPGLIVKTAILPFLPFDLIKALVAALVSARLAPLVRRGARPAGRSRESSSDGPE